MASLLLFVDACCGAKACGGGGGGVDVCTTIDVEEAPPSPSLNSQVSLEVHAKPLQVNGEDGEDGENGMCFAFVLVF